MEGFEELIGKLSLELQSGIDRGELVHACQQGRVDDRVFCYEDIVRKCYIRVFRSYGGELYWFTGRVWEKLSGVLLYNGFRDALVVCAHDFFPSIRSDINKCLGRILGKVSSACCSVLGLSPSIVGFRNCVVDFGDISSPVVHKFADRMPVVSLLGYDYDPDAVCPVWDSFLGQMLGRSQRVLLQKFLGLGCVDRRKMPQAIEKTLWLVGSGANGKSTIQEVVAGVFGRDKVGNIRLDDLLNRRPDERMRSMMMIMGKVFNYSDEVHEADISRNTDTFKALCSGDVQAVRSLGKDIVMSDAVPFLICNMNKRPDMRNIDKAIVRRLLQIKFRASVSEDDMDLELGEKLRKEYSGIRNWMVEGYKLLASDGFKFGDELTEGSDMSLYLENGKTVDAYLMAMGMRWWVYNGHLDEKPQWVLSSLLYSQYVRWCVGHGHEADSMSAFGRQMKEKFEYKKASAGVCYAIYADGDIAGGYQEK